MFEIRKLLKSCFSWRVDSLNGLRGIKNYWPLFFNFQYFLLCCPFRISAQPCSNSNATNKFIRVIWLPQKILCTLFLFLNVFWTISYFRQRIPKSSDNPSEYLLVVVEICIIIQKLSLLNIYWFHSTDLVKVCNFIARKCKIILVPSPSRNVAFDLACRIGFTCLCLSFTILSLIKYVFWVREDTTRGLSYLTTMYNKGTAIFLPWFRSNTMAHNQTLSTYQQFFAVITVVSEFQQEKFNSYLILAALLPVLTMWLIASSFQVYLLDRAGKKVSGVSKWQIFPIFKVKPKNTPDWLVIRKQYELLQEVSRMINKIYAWNITAFLLKIMFYYSTQLSRLIVRKLDTDIKIINLVYLIISFSLTCLTFLLAGDICTKVSTNK